MGNELPPPPVFIVDDLQIMVVSALRRASAIYWSVGYTREFDALMLLPERRETIGGFLAGTVPSIGFTKNMMDWLLRPWSSVRSLPSKRINALGQALEAIRPIVATMPPDLQLESADNPMLRRMVEAFDRLDQCAGVGATIASKLLAPLRPALFPMWDNPIAHAYGFAANSAGYFQYLATMRAIARKIRCLWNSKESLEVSLKPQGREWTAPLAKVLDEWNWICITKRRSLESGTT